MKNNSDSIWRSLPNSAMFAHTTKDFFPIRRRMIFPIRYCTENSLFPREVHNISTVSAICLRWLLLSVIFCQVRILRNSNKVFQKYLPIILQALHRYPRSLCIIWWAFRQIGKRSALTENKGRFGIHARYRAGYHAESWADAVGLLRCSSFPQRDSKVYWNCESRIFPSKYSEAIAWFGQIKRAISDKPSIKNISKHN